MSDFFQITASGLSLGANYALIALGFVVIYRASQVFNFAHGEFVGIGAYLMTTFVAVGLPWPLALVASMVGTGAVAALVERAVVRPMIGRPVFVTIILTIFVGYLLRTAIIVAWGIDLRNMPVPWDVLDGIKFGEVAILYNELAAIAVGLIALGGFFVVLKYTRLGVAMRAASGDQEVALALGIPVGRVFRATWFIAGMLAALAGIFLVMFPKYLDPNIGFVALAAFPAAVVGGLASTSTRTRPASTTGSSCVTCVAQPAPKTANAAAITGRQARR